MCVQLCAAVDPGCSSSHELSIELLLEGRGSGVPHVQLAVSGCHSAPLDLLSHLAVHGMLGMQAVASRHQLAGILTD
jgi:hypothetical protein